MCAFVKGFSCTYDNSELQPSPDPVGRGDPSILSWKEQWIMGKIRGLLPALQKSSAVTLGETFKQAVSFFAHFQESSCLKAFFFFLNLPMLLLQRSA